MNCISPPALDDRQLLAYVDGEADSAVAAHLERCTYCSDKARAFARLQNRLTARLYRLTCPTPSELGDYHLGMLPTAHRVAVAQHLRECPHCSREVAQLRSYLRDLAPEPGVREQVKVRMARLVSGTGKDRPRGAGPLAPAVAGIRGEYDEPYIYQVDEIQVAIEVQADVEQPDRKVLLGLITGLEARPLTAQLWQDEQSITTAAIDESGNFTIPHLISGQYALILNGPEVEIQIQALEV